MSDHKKNQTTEEEQKMSATPDTALTSVNDTKKRVRKAPKVKKPRKRSLPIAVDILIVVALIGLIIGAICGIYATINIYSEKYVQRDITYTLYLKNVDAALAYDAESVCVVLEDSTVFVQQSGESTPVGSVESVVSRACEDATVELFVTVRTVADYDRDNGYFVNETKIAVGKAYSCRFSGLISDAVIVELQPAEKES